jgi:hypothetical protein
MEAVVRILLNPSRVWLTPLAMAIGAIFGIAGTWLLYSEQSVDLVFFLFLISNLAWVCASIRSRQFWLFSMNACYLTISILAVIR